jgi:hypothetical protein
MHVERRRQAIQFFGAQDAPVTVGLLVDSSGSMQPIQRHVVVAAGAFVETSNPQDEVFALTFGDRVAAALPPPAPLTSDPSTLRIGLARAMSPRGRSALYDALLAGLDIVGKGRYERRVLVAEADGGENASTVGIDEVLARVQTSSTPSDGAACPSGCTSNPCPGTDSTPSAQSGSVADWVSTSAKRPQPAT